MDVIREIQKQDTIVAGPPEVARQVHATALTVEPDKEYSVGTIDFRTVAAYNLGKEFHPKRERWVGYVITLSTGQVIYHSGDTDSIPEMRRVVCDIALLPCGGTYTMTAKEAADAANAMQTKAVIPMHWGDIVGSEADAKEFARVFKGETIIKKQET